MEAKVLIQEIAKALAVQKSIDKKDAQVFVQSFFDVILEALKKDKYVKIKGLGTFKQIEVESRESMNIHTGERFEIMGHAKISFTPEASLKDAVNKPFAHFETVPLNDEVSDSDLDAIDARFQEEEAKNAALSENEETAVVPVSVEPEITAEPEKQEQQEEIQQIEEQNVTEESVVETPVETKQSEGQDIEQEIIEEPEVNTTEDEDFEKSVSVSESKIEQPVVEPSVAERKVPAGPDPHDYTPPFIYDAEWLEGEDLEDDEEQDDEDDDKHSKYFWRLAAVAAIVILAVGYFIGRYTFFKPSEVQVVMYDTVFVLKKVYVPDSLNIDSLYKADDSYEEAEVIEDEAPVVPVEELSVQNKPEKKQQQVAEQQKKQPEKKQPEKKQPEKQLPVQKTTDKYAEYPQLPGGAYWIVGTAQTYKIRSGETIRIIAERFFGSRQMAPYIIKYNGVADPDHVGEGTVLKIPALELKKK